MAKKLHGAALRASIGGPINRNDLYHYAGGEARKVTGVDQTNGRSYRSSKKEINMSIEGAGNRN